MRDLWPSDTGLEGSVDLGRNDAEPRERVVNSLSDTACVVNKDANKDRLYVTLSLLGGRQREFEYAATEPASSFLRVVEEQLAALSRRKLGGPQLPSIQSIPTVPYELGGMVLPPKPPRKGSPAALKLAEDRKQAEAEAHFALSPVAKLFSPSEATFAADNALDRDVVTVGQALSDGATLMAGTTAHKVVVNPPQVRGLRLPDVVLTGVECVAQCDLSGVDEEACVWTWCRGRIDTQLFTPPSDGAISRAAQPHVIWERTPICSTRCYLVSSTDIGCLLRVSCRPGCYRESEPTPNAEGSPRQRPPPLSPSQAANGWDGEWDSQRTQWSHVDVFYGKEVQAVAPLLVTLSAIPYLTNEAVAGSSHRWSKLHGDGGESSYVTRGDRQGAAPTDGTAPKPPKPPEFSLSAFRVLSYNLLQEAPQSSFPASPAEVLRPDYRRTIAAAELAAYDADVLALQGIDPACFESFWAPLMNHRGFGSAVSEEMDSGLTSTAERHTLKQGVAIFFRKSKFAMSSSGGVGGRAASSSSSTAVAAKLPSCSAAQIVTLDLVESTVVPLDVMNEGIGDNVSTYPRGNERARQLLVVNALLLPGVFTHTPQLDQARAVVKAAAASAAAVSGQPMVLCGDWCTPNLQGTDAAVCATASQDIVHYMLHPREGEHALELSSVGGVPPFTSITGQGAVALPSDFIFFTQQRMGVAQLVPTLTLFDVAAAGGVPSATLPSNHSPVVADLALGKYPSASMMQAAEEYKSAVAIQAVVRGRQGRVKAKAKVKEPPAAAEEPESDDGKAKAKPLRARPPKPKRAMTFRTPDYSVNAKAVVDDRQNANAGAKPHMSVTKACRGHDIDWVHENIVSKGHDDVVPQKSNNDHHHAHDNVHSGRDHRHA